jgi:Flp pilus assembly pilin Flp
MRTLIGRLIADRAGSNVIEYALILALISLTIVFAAAAVANDLAAVFVYLAGKFLSVAATL